MDIVFNAHQNVVLGMTGTGKTFATAHSLKKTKKGVFFFNTMRNTESVPKSFTVANSSSDLTSIERLLDKGGKVNYMPSSYKEQRNKELAMLIQYFLDSEKKRDIYFVIDEVHTFYNEKGAKAKDEIIRMVTTSRNYGIKGIYLSQRPARVENDILENSGQWVLYKTPLSHGWLSQYGLPADEIVNKLKNAPDFSYVVYDFKQLKGIYKVNI